MERIAIPSELKSYVTEIIIFENQDVNAAQSLPLYADGFAGIIYSQSTNPFYLQPRNKQLSNFYLYGQTIEPMSLDVKGPFKLFALKLYPFAVRILLEIDPKNLNDDCFNLFDLEHINTKETVLNLNGTHDNSEIIGILCGYFLKLLKIAATHPDYRIKLAINLIMREKGKITIKEVRNRLSISERTFERHFQREIGVTPKQFANIIQFSASMKQIKEADYTNLKDIAYENGYADQSHFIRAFKRYTGLTPKEIQNQLAKTR